MQDISPSIVGFKSHPYYSKDPDWCGSPYKLYKRKSRIRKMSDIQEKVPEDLKVVVASVWIVFAIIVNLLYDHYVTYQFIYPPLQTIAIWIIMNSILILLLVPIKIILEKRFSSVDSSWFSRKKRTKD